MAELSRLAMKVLRLGWMGARTQQFDQTNQFYRDVLGLDVLSMDDSSGRFKLEDGTEVHVYGPKDTHHEFFGEGPVVAFEVDDFAVAQSDACRGSRVHLSGAAACCGQGMAALQSARRERLRTHW